MSNIHRNNLKAIRTSRRITLSGLAWIAGVTEMSIRNYEAGASLPSVEVAQRIAVGLAVPVAEIWPPTPPDYATKLAEAQPEPVADDAEEVAEQTGEQSCRTS